MNILLFDDKAETLFPFTLTRPIAEIRWGISSIKEKWERYAGRISYLTKDYLSEKYPSNYDGTNIYVNARLLPSPELIERMEGLPADTALKDGKGNVLLLKSTKKFSYGNIESVNSQQIDFNIHYLENTWDLFAMNNLVLRADYKNMTEGKKSQPISSSNTLLGNQIFIEEGAKVEACILNSTTGPIYLGKNSEIMEGSVIRGPFALCEAAVVKMSAKIYGASTIGPYSKVGGEISNSIIFGFSNKGHDGFLGNSILGEWCNLGADTNVSNLKNDYATVKIWDYISAGLKDTGQQFCGLMMGDHSKSGINTMFNTGTLVGVNANVFGSGFPEKFIPSFSWGGAEKMENYRLDKALQVAERVMARRNINMSPADRRILEYLYQEHQINKNF